MGQETEEEKEGKRRDFNDNWRQEMNTRKWALNTQQAPQEVQEKFLYTTYVHTHIQKMPPEASNASTTRENRSAVFLIIDRC